MTPGGIGYSFQLAITAPRMDLIGYGIATAQSCQNSGSVGVPSVVFFCTEGVLKVTRTDFSRFNHKEGTIKYSGPNDDWNYNRITFQIFE